MKIKFMFDNHINDIDQLIYQLSDLKKDAFYNMSSIHDEVFVKDFHALSIIISFLKELKEKRSCNWDFTIMRLIQSMRSGFM